MEPQHLTARQWQEMVLATRARFMARRTRLWPDGGKKTCPSCGKKALVGRSDLTREMDSDGAVLVFANLHGALCAACKAEFLEPYEQLALEERAGVSFRGPVSGSVTSLGGSKLGTYWPKDVAKALGLHAKDELRMTTLSADTVVVRVIHGHE